MSFLLRLIYKFAPPVRRYPVRAWYEWSQWHDPYRPLEPGEDWAGNVREIAFAADFKTAGRVTFKCLVLE